MALKFWTRNLSIIGFELLQVSARRGAGDYPLYSLRNGKNAVGEEVDSPTADRRVDIVERNDLFKVRPVGNSV